MTDQMHLIETIHGEICEDSIEECLDCGGACVKAARAVAPTITHAKAEALREAAEAILTNDPLDYWSQHLPEGLGFQEAMSKWLLAHAATIEGKSE